MNPRVSGMFSKVVGQAVLFFGVDTWVVTPLTGRSLGGFQHRLSQHITGRKPRRLLDGIWQYPLLETEIQEAVFEEMEAYVLKRQNTVAQYISTQTIMELLEETVRILGMWVAKRW